MNKGKLVIIIGGILLSILAVIVVISFAMDFFKSAPSTTRTPDSQNVVIPTGHPIPPTQATPATFTKAFYEWYIQTAQVDPRFPSTTQDWKYLSAWLTPDFVSNWNNIVENSDGNPVLLAQEYPLSWGQNISVQILDQSDTSATVLATFGTGTEIHKVAVSLIPTQYTWRISSVTEVP